MTYGQRGCADLHAGYSMSSPDGWFIPTAAVANRAGTHDGTAESGRMLDLHDQASPDRRTSLLLSGWKTINRSNL